MELVNDRANQACGRAIGRAPQRVPISAGRAPCWSKSNRGVRANKVGADHARPIGAGGVVRNLIARGGAFVYQRHRMILFLRPRFAPGPFSFENCWRRGHAAGSVMSSFWRNHAVGTFKGRPRRMVLMSPDCAAA